MTNIQKMFEILVNDSLENITVKELTLKEREKLFLEFEEDIKTRRRKEYLEIAKLLEGKDKHKYLVECANNNVASQDDIINEAQTINGITKTLNIVSSKKLNWEEICSNDSAIPGVLKAFYFAFGIDVPDEEELQEPEKDTSVINEKNEAVKQADFFEKIETKTPTKKQKQ